MEFHLVHVQLGRVLNGEMYEGVHSFINDVPSDAFYFLQDIENGKGKVAKQNLSALSP